MWIVTAHSQNELEKLLEARADGIILPLPGFQARATAWLPLESMVDAVQKIHASGSKVYWNALKMVEQQEISQLDTLLDLAQELEIDGIYIADEGWIWQARQKGMQDRLIYQPETLIVNGMDACWYENLGVQAVCLAHELSLAEIQAIARQAHRLEVLVQGRYSWMSSRRPLITNYFEEIGSPYAYQENEVLELQEANRPDRMRIVQDGSGTTVYTAAPIQSLKQLEALKKAGIQRFRIDTLFEPEDYGARMLEVYRQVENNPQAADALSAEGSDALYHTTSLVKKEG